MDYKKLYKDPYDKKLAGVCGGLGNYFNIDPTVVRLICLLLDFLTGIVPGIVVYILAAVIMTDPPEDTK